MFKKVIALALAGVLTAGASFAGEVKSLEQQNERVFIQAIRAVYNQAPSRGYVNMPLAMDILRPEDNKKYPAIIFVTGGGFINANKDSNLQQRLELAERGFVVASIEYRVAPVVTFPEPLIDVKAAVRFLRAHAEKFGVIENKIGLLGNSAGGYLVSIAGTTNGLKDFDKGDWLDVNSDVQCVVDLYGVTDLQNIAEDYPEDVKKLHRSPAATEALWVNGSPVFGGVDGPVDADEKALKAAQPIEYISEHTPPFLIMHGTNDKLVSFSQGEKLFKALDAKNIPVEFYKLEGAAHGGPAWVQPEVMKVIGEFFEKNLK